MKSSFCYFGLHDWKLVTKGNRYNWFKCKRRACVAEKCESRV